VQIQRQAQHIGGIIFLDILPRLKAGDSNSENNATHD